jgi:hypothetical protein
VSAFPDCPSGSGSFKVMSRYVNDLLWAEGLLRTNQNLALAATLINNSRVTRGGLPPVTAADGFTNLMKALLYEWHVELVSQADDHLFNGRRLSKTNLIAAPPNPYATGQQLYEPEGAYVWNSLWGNTPRSMPIPAKDLSLLALEIYSFGGPDDPLGCGGPDPKPTCSAGQENTPRVRNVREIYQEMMKSMPKPGSKPRRF